MREIVRNIPLFAVEAVAVDTETTGLDPRSARVIEIGAVVVRDAAVIKSESFRRLLSIPEEIPTAATAVHGITKADLSGAPPFDQAFSEVVQFIGERLVVGHTVGFDLAVLRRECDLAGLRLPAWPILDTRLLAETVAPSFPGFSLEDLGAWLGIEVADRHRALGDALLTARIFVALLPRLRAAGIRTVAEAQAACARLVRANDGYQAAGWIEPNAYLRDEGRTERTFDSYPYRHRVRQVMSHPPLWARDDARVRDVLASMMDGRVSSHFVGIDDDSPQDARIVTERDILRAVRQRGPEVLDAAVSEICRGPLVTVTSEAFVYRAIGRMRRFNIRHLGVEDEDGWICGALSARDLLKLRADTSLVLGDEIDQAGDVAALARAWARVPSVASSLLEEGISAREIAGIVARELGALTRRAGQIAESELEGRGAGRAPCSYALLVLGSAGRGESLLALDQDHAIVFADGEPDGPEDGWFKSLGERIGQILHVVGVPYCAGGVMSGTVEYRGSLRTWRERIARWVARAAPEDLLNVDIFYDFRPVHGDSRLAAELWHEAWQAAGEAPGFLRLLAESGSGREPPIGFFGKVRTEDGRVDLKRYGLWPIVESARLMALRHGVARRSTADRLEGVRALGIGGAKDLSEAAEAHERLLKLILRAQLRDIHGGAPASNRVPLSIATGDGGAAQLRADLRLAASLTELARDQIAP